MSPFHKNSMKDFFSGCKRFLLESSRISLTLFKIMIPIIIAVKILKELGAIEYLAIILGSLMEMVGLPGGMGLVWATAMITNLYGGMAVFVSLAAEYPLTTAQVTVLTSMMLVAHALPVELRIAQKAGARLRAIVLLRVGGAFIFGLCLNTVFTWGGWFQGPNVPAWTFPAKNTSLLGWALGEVRSLTMIFLIILGLLVLMKVLNRLRITDIFTRLLQPLLILLGIGKDATPITIIGMTLGITYGGGLIIQGARSGAIDKRDVFFSLALMGLSHGLIEDTILMLFLGGHFLGLFWGRLLFSLITVYLLVKVVSHLSEKTLDRYLFRSEVS